MTLAIRLTGLGAQLSFTTFVALLVGDIASQFSPRHPALLFGVFGGSAALVCWRLLYRFFSTFEGA
jgi:hypothetical protein